MGEFENIDEFLGHSGSSRGGRYLKSWTKDGSIRIWLHTKRLPIASWRHNIPQLVVFDDKRTGEKVKAYWSRDQNCWEDESFLKNQYKRDEEGILEIDAPSKCGLCRLIDVVYRQIATEKLDWVQPVFRFEGSTDEKNDQVIYAGGLTGMFGSDRLSEQQTRFLKSKGIYQTEAWKQNFHAKLAYVFAVVDQDNVNDGVQIAPQTGLVGDKVKKVIRDSQASLGDEAGNPMLHPFCIELTYDKAAPINQRYHARKIERYKITPEIERLIKGDPPDLRSAVRSHNQKAMLAFLQRHAVIDLPWDEIYRVPELVAAGDDDEFPPREEEPSRVRADPSPGRRRQTEEEPPPRQTAPDVSMIPCDKCGSQMREDEEVCKKCGAKYTFAPDPTPSPGKVSGDRPPFGKFG